MRAFIIVTLLLLTSRGNAQSYWSFQYDWNQQYEYLSGIELLQYDTSILITGSTNPVFPVYASQFFNMKIGLDGNVIWKKPIDLGSSILGGSIGILSVDKYHSIIEGSGWIMHPDSTYEHQQIFLKISNETGDTVWVKNFGKLNWSDNSRRLIKSADGGYVLIGETFSNILPQQANIVLLKVDSFGNQVFRKTYLTEYDRDNFGWSLCETNDHGFLLVCFTKHDENYKCGGIFPSIVRKMVIIRTNSLGNKIWEKIYAPTECYQDAFLPSDVLPLENGDFLLAGWVGFQYVPPDFALMNTAKYYIAVLSPTGEVISYAEPIKQEFANAFYWKMIPTADTNYLLVGNERDSSQQGQTSILMKVMPDGNLLWKREYRVSPPESKNHDLFFDVIEMPDKGFVACGRCYGPLADSTYQNGWVIRVDSLGCLVPGCDTLISTTVEPPIIINESHWKIYPNPTSDKVTVELDEDAFALNYRLYSMDGKVVEDMQFLPALRVNRFSIELGGKAAGIYLLALRLGDGSWQTRRVVLTK